MEEIVNIAYESIELLKEIREILTQEQNNELDNLRNRYNNYLDAIERQWKWLTKKTLQKVL